MSIKIIKKSQLVSLLQKGLREGFDSKYFDTTKNFNNERVKLLLHNIDFKKDIKKLREQIIKFDSSSQISIGEGANYLIDKFCLPPNFHDWLESYLEEGKAPHFIPTYPWELVDYVINNLYRIEKISLTTKEKHYILDMYKFRVKNNPRIPKKVFLKSIKELREALKRSKNTRRRFRTLDTALQTLRIGNKQEYYEPTSDSYKQTIIRKITSNQLAAELFEDNEVKKGQTLRKQKQRLKKRIKTILNKK